MNKRAMETLRIVAGLYLAYLGGDLIRSLIKGKPDNMVVMMLFGVLFLAVGGFVAISAMKSSFARLKAERDEAAHEEMAAEESAAEAQDEPEADMIEETANEAEAETTEEAVEPEENIKIPNDLKELKASGNGEAVEVIDVLKEETEE